MRLKLKDRLIVACSFFILGSFTGIFGAIVNYIFTGGYLVQGFLAAFITVISVLFAMSVFFFNGDAKK